MGIYGNQQVAIYQLPSFLSQSRGNNIVNLILQLKAQRWAMRLEIKSTHVRSFS